MFALLECKFSEALIHFVGVKHVVGYALGLDIYVIVPTMWSAEPCLVNHRKAGSAVVKAV